MNTVRKFKTLAIAGGLAVTAIGASWAQAAFQPVAHGFQQTQAPPVVDEDDEPAEPRPLFEPYDPDNPTDSKQCVYRVTRNLKKRNCDECPSVGDYVVRRSNPRTCTSDGDCPDDDKGWLNGCHGLFKKCKFELEFVGCQ